MRAPSIAKMKSMGVTQFSVTCSQSHCLHSTHGTFDRAGVAEAYEFPGITARRRFGCTNCGSCKVHIMPDWRNHKASGLGG